MPERTPHKNTRSNLKPSEIIVLRDTREKLELDISPLKWKTATLKTGDFSVEGMQDKITVELKALNDFVICCFSERPRFERELDRMREYPYRAIVIKSTWDAILLKQYHGAGTPNAILGSAMGFAMSCNVPIIMAGSHQNAGRMVSRLLWVAANRIHRENYKPTQ